MNYLLVAVLTAFIGVIPLLLRKRFITAFVVGAIAAVALWAFYWTVVPATIWPLATPVTFFAAVLWVVAAVIGLTSEDQYELPAASIGIIVAVPVVYFVILALTWVGSWGMFRAGDYAALLGQTPERNWTKIVQPKSPQHIRMIGDETALYLAKKAVASAGAIGSQFQVDEDHLTLQRVNGELVYVVPLDFTGFTQWTSTSGSGVPGYIIVDAQDPEIQPRLVRLPQDGGMRYTPGAYFGEDLKRYLREHGFLNDGLAEFNFELDESGHPWWVVPTFKPAVAWRGAKITGVAIVDPVSGAIHRFSIDQAPPWIDRIMPAQYVYQYLAWRGQYAKGFGNSFWSRSGITKPEEPHLIYSSDDRAEWVTGITSDTSKDDSLVAIAYTDSRTGKTVMYQVGGGATDSAIVTAVNANQNVNYKHLHGVAVQMYNVYGSMAAVVPLLNESGAYQALAIASVKNPQDVAIGRDQIETLRNYQAMLFRHGQQVSLANASALAHVSGTVDRIAQDSGADGSPYLIHVAGTPVIFTASSQDSIKVPLTRPGDKVAIDYVASGEGEVPVKSFDNLSLPLNVTSAQQQLTADVDARHGAADTHAAAEDTRKRLDDMSDQELESLGNQLK